MRALRSLRSFKLSARVDLRRVMTSKTSVIALILIAVCTLAFYLRIQPMKYGVYLYEYDPFFQYYLTKYLIDHGPFSWFELTKDAVKEFWYPWGRDVYKTEYPGVAYMGYLFYMMLRPITPWASEEQLLTVVSVVLPAFMGVLEVIAVFLIGNEVKDYKTGLLAAALQAVMPAALDRTIAGFYTKLGFGVTLFLWAIYFLVRGSRRGSLRSFIVSGAFMGLLAATWGGVTFAASIIGLYGLVVALCGLNDEVFTIGYVALTTVFLSIASCVPKLGLTYPLSAGGVLMLSASLILVLDVVLVKMGSPTSRRIQTIVVSLVLAVALLSVGWWSRVITTLPVRQLSIAAPWLRNVNVVFSTVAEHRPMSWDMLLFEVGPILPFIAPGVVLLLIDRVREKILIALATIASGYGVSSVAYLLHQFSPFAALASAYALSELIDVFNSQLLPREKIKRRVRTLRIDPVPIMAVLTAVIVIIGLTAALGYSQASRIIPTIAQAGVSALAYENHAWLNALKYIRTKLPEDAVIVSWWDYGYWITVGGNRTSVCDNATLNSTQIKLVAIAFMSDEEVAVNIMFNKLKTPPNNTYVVVYEPFYIMNRSEEFRLAYITGVFTADLGKASAMIRIAGFNFSEYYDERGNLDWSSDRVRNGTLFKLIINGLRELGYQPVQGTTPIVVDELRYFTLVRAFTDTAPNGVTVFVFLYKASPTPLNQTITE